MGKSTHFQILKAGVYWFDKKIDITYFYDDNCLAVESGKSHGFFSVPQNEITDKPVTKSDGTALNA